MFASRQFNPRQFGQLHFKITGADVTQSLVMTPDEARQNWCFATAIRQNRVVQTINAVQQVSINRCEADNCMAWDWATSDFTKGFCGYRGAPVLLFAREQSFRQGVRALSSAGTRYTMWDGPTALYPFLNAAEEFEVVSDNANDTAAGTGAQTVELTMLGPDFTQSAVLVTMNGTTPVPVPNGPYTAINQSRVASVGSNGKSAGTISIRRVTGSVVMDAIFSGETNSLTAVYTCPKGFNLRIIEWSARVSETTGSAGNSTAYMQLQEPNNANFTLDTIPGLNQSTKPEDNRQLPEVWLEPGVRIHIEGEEPTETDVTMFGRMVFELRAEVV